MRGKLTLKNFASVASIALVLASGCQSRQERDDAGRSGIVIVNAPAAGEVRRILAREGMSVNEGAPIVEIAIRTEAPNVPQSPTDNPQARAGRSVQTAQAEIEAARAEVVRHEVEVQRLTPLVASGAAPQAQLDGAQAEYERAQQRLQRAQSSAQSAQSGFVLSRQQSQNSPQATATPSERIVTANASSGGTISVINAQVGAQVRAGQPLATLRVE